jgi:hypothetical protein
MLEKECDYNRLLRIENKDMRDELVEYELLSSLGDKEDFNNNNSNNELEKYLS